jgi:hypothetical protein
LPDLFSIQFEPGLELKNWIHQEPVCRFVILIRVGISETCLDEKNVSGAKNLVSTERIIEKGTQYRGQNESET